jgi:Transmembrane secretion effector
VVAALMAAGSIGLAAVTLLLAYAHVTALAAAALEDARYSRRRTGAVNWRVWQDAADPDRVLEQFVVASWDEHLRQHERVTDRDQDRLNRIRAMTDPAHPTTVTHWLTPPPDRTRGSRRSGGSPRPSAQPGGPGS